MRDVLQQLLHELERVKDNSLREFGLSVVDERVLSVGRSALAQTEQKPVAWRFRTATQWLREPHWRYLETLKGSEGLLGIQPLYTAPPRLTWVGLDEDERTAIRESVSVYHDISGWSYAKAVQQATELKLKEKNT